MEVFGAYLATLIDEVGDGREGGERRRWVGPGAAEIDGVWWIVSAENPMDVRLGEAENLARHRRLGEVWPDAIEVVCSAAGWRERSWAVSAERGAWDAWEAWEAVLAQARRFEQRAVFRVTVDWVEVVMAGDGRDGEVVGRRDRWHREGAVIRGWRD